MDDKIIYEQPLTEAIRICLRLEKLQQQFTALIDQQTDLACNLALDILLETLKLVNRPDLKSKLSQCLSQINGSLSQMEKVTEHKFDNLNEVYERTKYCANQLHSVHGKFGDSLRYNEFIKSLILQYNIPAGLCAFTSPHFLLWNTLPLTQRITQLMQWYQKFELLNKTCQLILNLIRTSSHCEEIIASNGFHQQALPMFPPCYMVQIHLLDYSDIYPEISVGKHRLSLHFQKPSFEETDRRPKQFQKDVRFELTICQI